MTTRAPVVTASMYIASVDVCAVDCADFAKFDVFFVVGMDSDVADGGCEVGRLLLLVLSLLTAVAKIYIISEINVW